MRAMTDERRREIRALVDGTEWGTERELANALTETLDALETAEAELRLGRYLMRRQFDVKGAGDEELRADAEVAFAYDEPPAWLNPKRWPDCRQALDAIRREVEEGRP